MVIVLVTIFALGGLTIDTLKYLNLEIGVDPKPHLDRVCDSISSCLSLPPHLTSPHSSLQLASSNLCSK